MNQEVTLATLILGYELAFSRFVDADSSGVGLSLEAQTSERQSAYLPLFEALNWAVAIDDYLDREDPEWWETATGGEVMRGIRFARNRVHHQWADAFGSARREGATDPLSYEPGLFGPSAFAAPFAKWYWAVTLPEGHKDPKGEELYREHLAGQPVRAVLSRLHELFRVMEPPY